MWEAWVPAVRGLGLARQAHPRLRSDPGGLGVGVFGRGETLSGFSLSQFLAFSKTVNFFKKIL